MTDVQAEVQVGNYVRLTIEGLVQDECTDDLAAKWAGRLEIPSYVMLDPNGVGFLPEMKVEVGDMDDMKGVGQKGSPPKPEPHVTVTVVEYEYDENGCIVKETTTVTETGR